MKMLKITLQGKTYEVGVEVVDGAASAASAPSPEHSAPLQPPAPVASGQTLNSPMTGIVYKICVSAGQQVTKDQVVLILEAMKMESPVYAPHAGTIASIHVKETDAVSEGQVLIQFS